MTTKHFKNPKKFKHPKHPKRTNTPSHTDTVTLSIDDLTHDGRGVATYDDGFGDKAGKKVFVSFALPTETVTATLTCSKKHFDEAGSLNVITKSPHRTTPICKHFGVCGGCALQHFDDHQQIAFKESVLDNHFWQLGLSPDVWLAPIIGERTHYRTKARLGVRYLPKTDRLIVGFRERASNFLTDIDECPILHKAVSHRLQALKQLLSNLHTKAHITHLQIAVGEPATKSFDGQLDLPKIAMIVRHTKPLPVNDKDRLIAFGRQMNWQIFLQPNTDSSIHRIDSTDTAFLPNSHHVPPRGGLFYSLPDFDLMIESSPTDFTQINWSINRQMVRLACELLDLQEGERVLDLFCGLGNFSLALAKCVGSTGQVIGVEGSPEMVERAKMNAKNNKLTNTSFFVQDLTQDFSDKSWVGQVDALLIDPPRAGALAVMEYLGRFCAKRIVYVSCDPATLARDSAILASWGYRLTHAGVMDMFCHTAHVESIARFERVEQI